jgi:hypothetical protein
MAVVVPTAPDSKRRDHVRQLEASAGVSGGFPVSTPPCGRVQIVSIVDERAREFLGDLVERSIAPCVWSMSRTGSPLLESRTGHSQLVSVLACPGGKRAVCARRDGNQLVRRDYFSM